MAPYNKIAIYIIFHVRYKNSSELIWYDNWGYWMSSSHQNNWKVLFIFSYAEFFVSYKKWFSCGNWYSYCHLFWICYLRVILSITNALITICTSKLYRDLRLKWIIPLVHHADVFQSALPTDYIEIFWGQNVEVMNY